MWRGKDEENRAAGSFVCVCVHVCSLCARISHRGTKRHVFCQEITVLVHVFEMTAVFDKWEKITFHHRPKVSQTVSLHGNTRASLRTEASRAHLIRVSIFI